MSVEQRVREDTYPIVNGYSPYVWEERGREGGPYVSLCCFTFLQLLSVVFIIKNEIFSPKVLSGSCRN